MGVLAKSGFLGEKGFPAGGTIRLSDDCYGCAAGKFRRRPFPHSDTRSQGVLDLIHSDVCGPVQVKTLGGARYFVTFIDDYTHYVDICFISEKSQVFEMFKQYICGEG